MANDDRTGLLYKYMGLQDSRARKRAQQILLGDQLYFPSPRKFNDPFDCRVFFRSPAGTKARKRFLDAYVRKCYPGISREERRTTIAQNNKKKQFATLLEKARQNVQNLVDDFGVLSLSAVPDSILMWSHYALSHTGLCLGFNTEGYFDEALPVKYQLTYPSIEPIQSVKETQSYTMAKAFLFTKSSCWAYEREWRLLKLDGDGPRTFPPRQLSKVILGCRMEPENTDRVRSWLNTREAETELFKAEILDDDYGLRIRRIKR